MTYEGNVYVDIAQLGIIRWEIPNSGQEMNNFRTGEKRVEISSGYQPQSWCYKMLKHILSIEIHLNVLKYGWRSIYNEFVGISKLWGNLQIMEFPKYIPRAYKRTWNRLNPLNWGRNAPRIRFCNQRRVITFQINPHTLPSNPCQLHQSTALMYVQWANRQW